MRFHHLGYVSTDPRVQKCAGTGIDRPVDIPDKTDVLIVGAGPAGMIISAQLSQFSTIATRIVDSRVGRLEVGQADGIQPRSIETFEAFGFADSIVAEGCRITETAFWRPDPNNAACIIRASRVDEDPNGVSEYYHITVNEARLLDYFSVTMEQSPTRMKVDFGIECTNVQIDRPSEYPVVATLSYQADTAPGRLRTVRSKYLVGADGAHSQVREAIGCKLSGTSSNHAWGVLDLLAITDFPDVRRKCAIQSRSNGNILLIPREGGHLFRLYVDLGGVPPGGSRTIRQTSADDTLVRAKRVFHPYKLDVRQICRYSVYEVGHRLCDRFDDVPTDQVGQMDPRVFVVGDAAHTHSAQAGQGMNVSMQDGFNLGWKLAHVLEGRSPASLLATYSAERRAIGMDIMNFDKTWSTAMAKAPDQFDRASEFDEAYLRITEFAQGFMTTYRPSVIVAEPGYQELAAGFPIGRRFKSAPATRVADASVRHIGHEATADGRWRMYVFADSMSIDDPASPTNRFAMWLVHLPKWLMGGRNRAVGVRVSDWFDVKVIYQPPYIDIDLNRVPAIYMPPVGPLGLTDYDGVYAATVGNDIFEQRSVDRQGVLVMVRPDQYVANVLPLTATNQLARFVSGFTGVQYADTTHGGATPKLA